MRWAVLFAFGWTSILPVGCGDHVADASDDLTVVTAAGTDLATALPELRGFDGATVKKLFDPRLAKLSHPEDRYYLEVKFGKLRREQFDELTKLFGGRSEVPFAADRSYDLTDFLHPAIQAVVNTTFATKHFDGARLKAVGGADFGDEGTFEVLVEDGLNNLTNCYNTTSEIVRMQHPSQKGEASFALYFPDRFKADDWFSNRDFSVVIDEKELRAGDVMVVRQRQDSLADGGSIVIHTAIAVSKEIIFEKTDSTDEDPYRLSLRKDALQKLGAIAGKDLIVEYRRFNGEGTKPIPTTTAPTNELEPRQIGVLEKAFPTMHAGNVTFSSDLGIGGGAAPEPNEILPAKVGIDPASGRGVLLAPASTLAHFVPLKGK